MRLTSFGHGNTNVSSRDCGASGALPHAAVNVAAVERPAHDSAGAPAVQRSPRQQRRQGGFTLIEVMVVIAIIGILAALIVPNIMSRPDQARRVAASQDIATMMQAMKLYRLDNGRFPSTDQGLRALIEKPSTDPIPNNWKDGGYLERLPTDPWGNPYQYLNPGVHGEIDIFSFGGDGKAGGEGNDADIGSWQ